MARRIQYEEILLHSIFGLHPMQPMYWSTFFWLCSQLLTVEQMKELEQRLGKVEMLVNGKERFIEKLSNGEIIIKERPAGSLSTYDIEMAFNSSDDYYAFFERPDGVKITKFDIEREFDKIRKWVFLIVREKAYNTRFTTM